MFENNSVIKIQYRPSPSWKLKTKISVYSRRIGKMVKKKVFPLTSGNYISVWYISTVQKLSRDWEVGKHLTSDGQFYEYRSNKLSDNDYILGIK